MPKYKVDVVITQYKTILVNAESIRWAMTKAWDQAVGPEPTAVEETLPIVSHVLRAELVDDKTLLEGNSNGPDQPKPGATSTRQTNPVSPLSESRCPNHDDTSRNPKPHEGEASA